MQDEHFMQGWNDGHRQFSAGLEQGFKRLADRLPRRRNKRQVIGDPYGIPSETGTGSTLSPAARASLRGLAASVVTAVLWVAVMLLATPMPGLAASPDAPLTHVECVASPLLA